MACVFGELSDKIAISCTKSVWTVPQSNPIFGVSANLWRIFPYKLKKLCFSCRDLKSRGSLKLRIFVFRDLGHFIFQFFNIRTTFSKSNRLEVATLSKVDLLAEVCPKLSLDLCKGIASFWKIICSVSLLSVWNNVGELEQSTTTSKLMIYKRTGQGSDNSQFFIVPKIWNNVQNTSSSLKYLEKIRILMRLVTNNSMHNIYFKGCQIRPLYRSVRSTFIKINGFRSQELRMTYLEISEHEKCLINQFVL